VEGKEEGRRQRVVVENMGRKGREGRETAYENNAVVFAAYLRLIDIY